MQRHGDLQARYYANCTLLVTCPYVHTAGWTPNLLHLFTHSIRPRNKCAVTTTTGPRVMQCWRLPLPHAISAGGRPAWGAEGREPTAQQMGCCAGLDINPALPGWRLRWTR
jgi:hypothetical protein